MSLHDELMSDAIDVLLDVQGTPALLLILLPGKTDWLRVDGLRGETKVERREEEITGNGDERRLVESMVVKAPGRATDGLAWEPSLGSRVKLGADPQSWSVDSIAGVGTGLITLRLLRSRIVNRQAGRRERE